MTSSVSYRDCPTPSRGQPESRQRWWQAVERYSVERRSRRNSEYRSTACHHRTPRRMQAGGCPRSWPEGKERWVSRFDANCVQKRRRTAGSARVRPGHSSGRADGPARTWYATLGRCGGSEFIRARKRVNARPPPRRRVSALAWRAARHACGTHGCGLAHWDGCSLPSGHERGQSPACILRGGGLDGYASKAIGRANGNEVWAQFKASAEYHPLVQLRTIAFGCSTIENGQYL